VIARPPGGRVAWLGVALAAGGGWQALLILVLLAAVLWAEEIGQAAAKALKALNTVLGVVRERARQRRELEAALGRQRVRGLCGHEHAEDVRDLTGALVARLCPQCDAQLPAESGVLGGTCRGGCGGG
jgi:hypothetical protein